MRHREPLPRSPPRPGRPRRVVFRVASGTSGRPGRRGDSSSSSTPTRFQRRSRAREVSPYWRWLTASVDRDALERRLLASDRSERAVFEVLPAALRRSPRQGHPGREDAGPPRLRRHPDGLVPGRPVVHIIRDPRAVYLSEVRRRRGAGRRPALSMARPAATGPARVRPAPSVSGLGRRPPATRIAACGMRAGTVRSASRTW